MVWSPEAKLLIASSRLKIDERVRSRMEVSLREELDWDDLVRRASQQGVAGLLYHNLKRTGMEPAIPRRSFDALKQLYYRNILHHLRMSRELAPVLRTLTDRGIPFLLLQGGSLLETVYGNPGLRPMMDIDLLVKAEDLAAVKAILSDAGLTPCPHYPDLFSQNGLVVDLHTDLINASRIASRRYAVRVDPEEVWNHAIPSHLWGCPIAVPCPSHAILLLSAHALKHSFNRLIWLVDLEGVMGAYGDRLDWTRLTRDAERFNLRRPLYYALRYLSEVMEMELPVGRLEGPGCPAPGRLERLLLDLLLQGRGREERGKASGFRAPGGLSGLTGLGDLLFLFTIPRVRDRVRLLAEIAFPRPRIMAQIFGIHTPWLLWTGYLRRLVQLGRVGITLLVLLAGCVGFPSKVSPPGDPPASLSPGIPPVIPAREPSPGLPSELLEGMNRNQVYTVSSERVPEYLIGPGDVLEVSLWEGTEEKKHTLTVRSDGRISISFLEDIQVAGLTAAQVDQKITRELARFVKRPRVDVLVKEYNSKKASLFGEINALETGVSGPGNYPLKGRTTLIDLLISAGGAKTTADLKAVKLLRGGKSYPLNLYKAMFDGEIEQNVVLDAGDVVIIPELSTLADKVIVLGEVDNPGIYPFKHQIDMAAAVSLAGGYLVDAAEQNTLVVRRDSGHPDHPQVFKVDLRRLLQKSDLSQNMALQSGDVIYVPRSLISDINYFVTRLLPILDLLTFPAIYRDLYTTGGGLRIDTGFPKTRTAPTFTIPVGGGSGGGR